MWVGHVDSSALVLTLLSGVSSESSNPGAGSGTASQPDLLNDPNTTPAANVEAARNESIVIDFCSDYVDAQLEYFRTSRTPDGVPGFAEKIRSSPERGTVCIGRPGTVAMQVLSAEIYRGSNNRATG